MTNLKFRRIFQYSGSCLTIYSNLTSRETTILQNTALNNNRDSSSSAFSPPLLSISLFTLIHSWLIHEILIALYDYAGGLRSEVSKIIWRFRRHLFLFPLCQGSCAKVFDSSFLPGFSPENSKHSHQSSPTWPGSRTQCHASVTDGACRER